MITSSRSSFPTFTVVSSSAGGAVVLMCVPSFRAKCPCRTRHGCWCSTGTEESSWAQSLICSARSPGAIKPRPTITLRAENGNKWRILTLNWTSWCAFKRGSHGEALTPSGASSNPTCSEPLLAETPGWTQRSSCVVSGVWNRGTHHTKEPSSTCSWRFSQTFRPTIMTLWTHEAFSCKHRSASFTSVQQ